MNGAPPRCWPGLLPAATAQRWQARAAAAAQASAGPLRLDAVLAPDEAFAALAPLRGLLAALPLCNLDQCWWRSGRPPNHWHQDGALHHDFAAGSGSAPLTMCTLWIALTPCGVDAPGLQWVEPSPTALLPPAALDDAALAAAGGRRCHVALGAGDALSFDGALLHRTQPMTQPRAARLSLELRFFADPPPPRVAHERLRRWAGAAVGVRA